MEARKLAVEDMTAKAIQLADNAGVSLGDLVFISDSVGASPRVDDVLEYATLKAVQSSAVDTRISGGELSATITVRVCSTCNRAPAAGPVQRILRAPGQPNWTK